MTRFMQSHVLALTPLTPIHVGCGVDFEPTNYVIDDRVLFHFDPATVPLSTDELRKLREAAAAESDQAIRRIQKFFFERKEWFAAASRNLVAVSSGVAAQYEERIGQIAQAENSDRYVVNVLDIERTAHHPHTGQAYLPGSSLKGAMRTAWLDQVNDGRAPEEGEKAADLERRLLGGAFHSDPFRLVKLSDAAGQDVVSHIVFSTNHKKRQVFDKHGKELSGKGPATRREAIAPAQYRALRAEIRFDGLAGPAPSGATPPVERRVRAFEELVAACNRFYLKRLNAELAILETRRLATDEWIGQLRRLLGHLREPLETGRAMVLRVGRHSGAESVTLEGVRSIRIMRGRGEPPGWSDESTTLWLAAEREDARSQMQPFGFLLAELADAPETAALEAWCDMQLKPDLAAAREWVRVAKERQQAEVQQQRQVAAEKRAHEEARERAAIERSARIARLSEHGRQIESLRERLEAHAGKKQQISGALYEQTRKLLQAAFDAAWDESDKRALADLVADLGFQKIDFGGKEKEIKRAIKQLRGEQ